MNEHNEQKNFVKINIPKSWLKKNNEYPEMNIFCQLMKCQTAFRPNLRQEYPSGNPTTRQLHQKTVLINNQTKNLYKNCQIAMNFKKQTFRIRYSN